MIHGVHVLATLDAIVCREALFLAEDLLLQQLSVASDSKQVVGGISKGIQGRSGPIISEIQLRASIFDCKFAFEVMIRTMKHIV